MVPEPIWCVIAGGGTAGHVLPGLAVARALVDRGHDPSSIRFVLSERTIDADLVGPSGFGFTTLPGRGLDRRLSLANVSAVWGLSRAAVRAFGLIRRHRPSVVLAVGGYASVAVTLAAVLLRVPLVVAEQNARAGLANRVAGVFARACAIPFVGTDLPRATVTGNPVRPEVLEVDRERDRRTARAQLGLPGDRRVVLAFAGSLGARRINEAVLGLVDRWQDRDDVAIHHVVGRRDWDALEVRLTAPESSRLVYHAVPYEARMPLAYAAADVAVCRAGGTTVAELAVVGLPAILVPLPIAPRDHQTANAAALVAAGAARLVPDGELDAERLDREISPLLDTDGRLEQMADAARAQARPDAAAAVADLVEGVSR